MLNASMVTIAKAPISGVTAVQTITTTGGPTGGTFTLTFGGQTTTALQFNETAANVQAALVALSSIGAGNVACTGGILPTGIVVTFTGTMAGLPQATITHTDSLTGGAGPAVAVAATVTGIQGSYRGVAPGCTAIDTTNGNLYSNTGTAATPTWTVMTTN